MKRIRTIYSLAGLALISVMSGCATNKICPGAGCTSDDDTIAAVNAAISAHPDLGAPNQIQVASSNHIVYLSGLVNSGYQRSVAGDVAANTNGVFKVVNSISVSK